MKYCVDCEHFGRTPYDEYCKRPREPSHHPVFGPVMRSLRAVEERHSKVGCGRAGRFFEQKKYLFRFWKNRSKQHE